MSINNKAKLRKGTEQQVIESFIDRIRPQVESFGCKIESQVYLPYTNFCDRINSDNKGVGYVKGKNYYATDILIYQELKNGDKIPLVVIEGKINGHSTHDAITYSEKAQAHKSIFPHLRYGFIVLNAVDKEFKSIRYYLHSSFDFEEIFPNAEGEVERNERVANFVKELGHQISIAKAKYRVFFKKSAMNVD